MVDTDPVQDLAVKMKDSNLNEYGTIKNISYNKRKNQLSFQLTYDIPSNLDPSYPTGNDLRAALFMCGIEKSNYNSKNNTIELEGKELFKLSSSEDFVFIDALGPENEVYLQAYKITLKWASESTQKDVEIEDEEK